MSGADKFNVRVTEVVPLNALVTRFSFQRLDGGLLPTFSGGAHTIVEMKDAGTIRRNPYSLMSDPRDQSHYSISVRRDDAGRGGSLFMHNNVAVGDEMIIGNPVNLFSLDLRARKQLMIAGGIGITPFLAQIHQLDRTGGAWELHYASRNAVLGSYVDTLVDQHPDQVNIYFDDDKQTIDLIPLLSSQPLGTHLYVCGPKGMINWVKTTAYAAGWPQEAVHFEEFLAPRPGKPFEVTLAASNMTLQVGENQSLLEAIEAAGVDAPYLCRGGACGQCETRVLSHDGEFLHHDHWLSDEEKASGRVIMPCVSRFAGSSLVLDR